MDGITSLRLSALAGIDSLLHRHGLICRIGVGDVMHAQGNKS